MADISGRLILHGETQYNIIRPIGTWGPAYEFQVYKANVNIYDDSSNTESDPDSAAFKVIRTNAPKFTAAVQDFRNSESFINVPSILPYTCRFEAIVNRYESLCIVLPHDPHVSSLRSIMRSIPRFNRGMEELLISRALYEALSGLVAIHESGKCHTRITAGNICYNYDKRIIQLAYAASAYEKTIDPMIDELNWCLINSLLSWGLAPEVKDGESLEFVDEYESQKSDIWLIGIVALELAYGKIEVGSRRELLDIARYLSSEHGRLMNTWEELRIISAEFIENRMQLSVTDRIFTEYFDDFVAKCLASDPEERPSAEDLMKRHVFFEACLGGMKYFHDMVEALNPLTDQRINRRERKAAASFNKKKSFIGVSFRHEGSTYTNLKSIGRWGPQYKQPVYEAVTRSGFNDPSPQHIALKLMKNNSDPAFDIAVDDVSRSTLFGAVNSILPLKAHFYEVIKTIQTLCMVLPYDGQVLSLRSIISSRPQFACGIPQSCIAVALRQAVGALHTLHTSDEKHTEINAGNIVYDIEDESIKLAFAASAYERTYVCPYRAPAEESSECPIKRLLHWALPPELQSDTSSNFVHEYDSEKADIWFIGITALELAYGRIRVAEPIELLDIASYISNVGKLPNTWEDLRTASAEEELKKIIPQKRFLRFPTRKKVPRKFDENFGNFVAMCLATNPQERPSTEELLSHDFLENIDTEANMAVFKATMIRGYRDLDKKKAVVIS